jgi:hypothetical protein
MKYTVIRNPTYDFAEQSYASRYPNLHKYPATMLPQIGIEILRELGINKGNMLDPYCGSGSSFTAGLECGIQDMTGFDINPLAVLIAKAKFTKVGMSVLREYQQWLRASVDDLATDESRLYTIPKPKFTNVDYWFSETVLLRLAAIKCFIDLIEDEDLKRLFLIAFSETARACSYVRNNEFKLYRMKPEDMAEFKPDVFGMYFDTLNRVIQIYEQYYLPKLNTRQKITIDYKSFKPDKATYDVVLTSPPYGDSKTTVAYGQFSLFANEWLGIAHARRIDAMLMGGRSARFMCDHGLIADYVKQISRDSLKRALEVSAFYDDLQASIYQVADAVKPGGIVIYVVGNRRVKNVQLPTDQFIAEKFEEKGMRHVFTYERQLSNKVMPSKNSPTNKTGDVVDTMSHEYIVVCER